MVAASRLEGIVAEILKGSKRLLQETSWTLKILLVRTQRGNWYWKLEERGLFLRSDGKFSNNVSCSKVENKKYTYF